MAAGPRIRREKKTIAAMIELYCRSTHRTGGGGLCSECTSLLDYALKRLDHCPHQELKPTCGKCRTHCYKPAMQSRVVEVMRFSGPRMILHHPILAMYHLLDGYRNRQSPSRR
jgi:hypothetical protein